MVGSADIRDRPLVMHVVYRFGIGGLENGLVNLLNRLPSTEFRHAIVALTECDPAFCRRLRRDDVELVSLRKPAGHGWRVFRPFWRLVRARRPAIVHTRNLAALEMQIPARAAGVPIRLHGEHGRDAGDPEGKSLRYRVERRALRPFVTHYVAVSADLARYLIDGVGVPKGRVSLIENGVDDERFSPAAPSRFDTNVPEGRSLIVGTVGRLDQVKDQRTLIQAVGRLVRTAPGLREMLRLRIIGEGPMRSVLTGEITELDLEGVVELIGEREDIPEQMQRFDVFVLPSIAEGMSNTILEAMATGLPVVATAVGANRALVQEGLTGRLVPPADPGAMADAIAAYLDDASLRREHGRRGRAEIEANYSLARMVDRYAGLYRAVLSGGRALPSPLPE